MQSLDSMGQRPEDVRCSSICADIANIAYAASLMTVQRKKQHQRSDAPLSPTVQHALALRLSRAIAAICDDVTSPHAHCPPIVQFSTFSQSSTAIPR